MAESALDHDRERRRPLRGSAPAPRRHRRPSPVSHEFVFSPRDFGRVRHLILAYAGISLHERKENMVYNRLARRLRATGRRDFGDYLDWVERPGSEERERFVNALTTNLTAFFREPHHFEGLAGQARQARGR